MIAWRFTRSGHPAAFFLRVLVPLLFLWPWLVAAQATPEAVASGQAAHASATGSDASRVDAPVGASDLAALQAQALAAGLDRQPAWTALLHVSGGQPQVPDPGFILSLPAYSPRQELLATIAALYGPDGQAALCRFPARYTWLQQQGHLPARSLAHCLSLQELLSRAPAQELDLAFASENLAQPSSMMGHLMLKTRGVNERGQVVEHALSFFTDAGTLNLPKLFFDSMVVGKRGYFALTPYQETIREYVIREQRSLWEYELRLTDDERRLLMLHVEEMRQTTITYYFQSYNCATLIRHMLAVVQPDLQQDVDLWVTPKSVIQSAQAHGMVASVSVKTSSRWVVRNLLDQLPNSAAGQVAQSLDTGSLGALDLEGSAPRQQRYLLLALARADNTYRYEQGRLDAPTWSRMDGLIADAYTTSFQGLSLQADQANDPAVSPHDKQWSVGWQRTGRTSALKLGLQPASHTLADDNRVAMSETELRLFDAAVLVEPSQASAPARLRLDHLIIYRVQSLLPRDALTGGLSGGFHLGWDRQFDAQLRDRSRFAAEGALGITRRIAGDIDAFALMWGGWVYQGVGGWALRPTVGAVVREIGGWKSVVSLDQTRWLLGQQGHTTALHWTQTVPLDGRNNLVLDATQASRADRRVYQTALSLRHQF